MDHRVKYRQDLLKSLEHGLDEGIVSAKEINDLVAKKSPVKSGASGASRHEEQAKHRRRPGVIDGLFYVAGIILYATIVSLIAQTWESSSAALHILLSLGVGLLIWVVAYILGHEKNQSDVLQGLSGSLVVSGSLLVITGGFIVMNEAIGGFDEVDFIPASITFAVLALMHFIYAILTRRNSLVAFSSFLLVATTPSLLFGLIEDSGASLSIWLAIFIASALLLMGVHRVMMLLYNRLLGQENESRSDDNIVDSGSLDKVAAVAALTSTTIGSFGDEGLLWLALGIAVIAGMYYSSYKSQDANLLRVASFFTVISILIISFRYFSGLGITVSLISATTLLLIFAAAGSSVKKTYFDE